jgi:hypothetical protein
VEAQITADLLPPPALAMYIAGATVPISDCCDGLLWTRVGNVYPTDGAGNPFVSARPDFDIPAWAFPVETGLLFCHQVIDQEGQPIDAALETQYAHRDGLYRASVLRAAAERFPAAAGPCALGMRISPWTPIGPDGACSGGMVQITVIAASMVGTG